VFKNHKKADFGKSGAESGTRPSEQACNERQNPDKDLKRMQGCEPPIIQEADFGNCAVRVAQQRAQHVPVKNLLERSNSDSGYEVECKGFELPTIQDADFGKCGTAQDFCHSEYYEKFQNLRHSESLEKYYELANSYFSCYSESINADEKPNKVDENHNNVILNRHEQKMKGEAGICLARVPLIQDLSMSINNQTNRFRIKSGMTKRLNSCLSGMTKNTGLLRRSAPANGFANAYRLTILALLRMFALYRNDGKS